MEVSSRPALLLDHELLRNGSVELPGSIRLVLLLVNDGDQAWELTCSASDIEPGRVTPAPEAVPDCLKVLASFRLLEGASGK